MNKRKRKTIAGLQLMLLAIFLTLYAAVDSLPVSWAWLPFLLAWIGAGLAMAGTM